MKRHVLIVFLALAACPSSIPGPAGPQGTPGVAGAGLSYDSSGSLMDGLLLPASNCKSVTLADPSAGDLADQIAPYLVSYRCLNVTLKAGTVWKWNKLITTREGQALYIVGEGCTNEANDITVIIQMTENGTFTRTDPQTSVTTDYRAPMRLEVGSSSTASIQGVRVEQTQKDPRGLTLQAGGALFISNGVYATLELSQIIITSNEDVVGVGSRAFMNIRFGHTWIRKAKDSSRDIVAVKSYTGWDFGGGFGFVHASHTHLIDSNGAAKYPTIQGAANIMVSGGTDNIDHP